MKEIEIPRGNGERILVAGDDEVAGMSAKEMLKGLGYNVTLVSDGTEAYKMFVEDTKRFDAIILDLEKGGSEAITIFEKMNEISANNAFVLMHDNWKDEGIEEFYATVEYVGILTKPLEKRRLSFFMSDLFRHK